MISRELKNWPIFSLLDFEFLSKIHMVMVYGNLGNEALIVTKDDTVYALGSNTYGCLGIGDDLSTLTPKKVEELCGKSVKTFAYGVGPHVLALTEKGEVYSWGHNRHAELGIGSINPVATPTLVRMYRSEKFIVDIACGSYHSVALTNDGEVFAWGQNNSGQVGSNVSTTVNVPKKVNSVLANKRVVSIACGHSSSIAVTEKGEVYSWGCNSVGQLGIGNFVTQIEPCKAINLNDVVIEKVVCGYAHSLALSNKGVVYVWGGNSSGQLGLGNKTNCCNPVKLEVQEMQKVLDIAASHSSDVSVAMGIGNMVFIWGHCLGQTITVPILTPLTCLHDAFPYYASCRAMHKPLVLRNEDNEMSIINHLKEAFDDPTTSDLTIQVEDKAIYVHKAILKIRSHYFRAMFQDHWTENNQNVLVHDQFSYDVYRAFLKYLYTDKIDVSLEIALELIDLASAYFENQLGKCCLEIIKKHISIDNVIFLYNRAIDINVKELEDCCLQFALNHMTDVILTKSFAGLDQFKLQRFMVIVAKAGAFKT